MIVNKYDRQIRIWGSKGQKRLSEAKVALIGCSGQGIEALKNLILPGVGSVDIFDDQVITVNDLSSSFFYEYDSVGRQKGEEASKNLLEMNPDVKGKFVNSSVKQVLQNPDCIKEYSLIISGNLLEDQNKKLSQICQQYGIPVIFISAVGFFFSIRTQTKIHYVQNQNTSSKKFYLRLHDPFPSLEKYASSKQLDSIISKLSSQPSQQESKQLEGAFSKITYPVFLIKSFKQVENKKSQSLKQLLNKWRNLVGEDSRDGINQAISRTFDLFQTPDNFLPDMSLLDDQLVEKADKQSDFILVFLKGVKVYFEKFKHLPQLVRMPDIHTSTKDYLELKNVYKEQHERNKAQLSQIIESLVPGIQIDLELLSEYINNIDALQIIKIRAFHQELSRPDVLTSCLNYLNDEKNVYLSIRAVKRFQSQKRRYPGPEDDIQVQKIAQDLAKQWGLQGFDSKYVTQLCRYQGKNIVHISSIAGAVTGQEAVKLITRCFAPMNSSYMYDGAHCKGYSIAL